MGWSGVAGSVIRSNTAAALGFWQDLGTDFSGGGRDGVAIELAVALASTSIAGEGQWRTRWIAGREKDMRREAEAEH